VRAIESALKFPDRIQLIAVAEDIAGKESVSGIVEGAGRSGVEMRLIERRHLLEIADTKTPSGLIAWIRWEPVRKPGGDEILSLINRLGIRRLLCLDSVSNPGNLGSLLRAAEAFGLDGVILGHGCVEVTNQKVVRAAAGSIFGLSLVVEGVSLSPVLHDLEKADWRIFRAEAHTGSHLPPEHFSEPWLLLMGNEAIGLDRELQNIGTALHIETEGSAESLNVAVAGGILLHALTHKEEPR
jgi:TrmH family RNA methyltransferase